MIQKSIGAYKLVLNMVALSLWEQVHSLGVLLDPRLLLDQQPASPTLYLVEGRDHPHTAQSVSIVEVSPCNTIHNADVAGFI